MKLCQLAMDTKVRFAVRDVGRYVPFYCIVEGDRVGLHFAFFVHVRLQLPGTCVERVAAGPIRLRRFVVRLVFDLFEDFHLFVQGFFFKESDVDAASHDYDWGAAREADRDEPSSNSVPHCCCFVGHRVVLLRRGSRLHVEPCFRFLHLRSSGARFRHAVASAFTRRLGVSIGIYGDAVSNSLLCGQGADRQLIVSFGVCVAERFVSTYPAHFHRPWFAVDQFRERHAGISLRYRPLQEREVPLIPCQRFRVSVRVVAEARFGAVPFRVFPIVVGGGGVVCAYESLGVPIPVFGGRVQVEGFPNGPVFGWWADRSNEIFFCKWPGV